MKTTRVPVLLLIATMLSFGSFSIAQIAPMVSSNNMGNVQAPNSNFFVACENILPDYVNPFVMDGPAFVNQFFSDFPGNDTEIADDFIVPDANSIICAVAAGFTNFNELWLTCDPNNAILMRIREDNGGLPGAIIFEQSFLMSDVMDPNHDFMLSPDNVPCLEANTRYWLSTIAVATFGICGQEFLEFDLAGTPYNDLPPHGINPGGEFGVGTDWFNAPETFGGASGNVMMTISFNACCAASPEIDDITLCPNDPDLKAVLEPIAGTGNTNSVVVASDDFDGGDLNLTARSNTTEAGTVADHEDQFNSSGDLFGITTGNSDDPMPRQAPFVLVDDAADINCPGYFQFDDDGPIPCNYGNNFFGAADTENGDNMGVVSADWVFNISGATGGISMICIDMASMGNYEAADLFDWSMDIDGGGFSDIFNLIPDEDISHVYNITNGPIELIDPLTLNGEVVDEGFEQYCVLIDGCPSGNTLTLRLSAITNGSDEAVAFDNIEIYGSIDPDQVVFNFYDQDPSGGSIDPLFTGASYCPGTTEQTSPETYWVTAVGCDGCESDASEVTVTVADNEKPEITCPDDISIELAPGECEIQVFYDLPTASDNCPGPVLIGHIGGPLSGDVLHKDDSPWTVTYMASDANGNDNICSFQIEIVEFQDPVTTITCNDHLQITLPSTCKLVLEPDMILEGGPYGCFDDFTVSVDGVVDATITLPGSYTVQVEDEYGNTCWTDVWVEDNLPPATLLCPCPPEKPCDFICYCDCHF